MIDKRHMSNGNERWRSRVLTAVSMAMMVGCGSTADTFGSAATTGGQGGAGVGGSGSGSGEAGAGGATSLPNATMCSGDSECQSGFCVDGVCCEAACTGSCVSCNEAGAAGFCTAVEPGTNNVNECNGGVCDGAGKCADGDPIWSDGFADDNAAIPGGGNVQGVGTDANGDVFITGYYSGSIKVGTTLLTSINGNNDIFVAKLTAAGGVLWAKSFGGPFDDYGSSLAVHPDGGIVVACSVRDAADLGATMLFHTASSTPGDSDGVVLRLTGAGDYMWHTAVVGANVDRMIGVGMSPTGEIVVTGDHDGVASFGSVPLQLTSGRHGFVARLDPSSGQSLWTQSFFVSSPGYRSVGRAVIVTNDGNVVVTGTYSPSGLPTNVYLGSFALATGAKNWEKHYGGTELDKGQAVAATADGGFWTTGYFTQEIDLSNAAIPACKLTSAGFDDSTAATIEKTKKYRDVYVAKFGANGEPSFCRSFGSYNPSAPDSASFPPHQDTGHGIVVDSQGNAVIAGRFRNTVDFGGGPRTSIGGTFDAFMLKLSTNGSYLWDVTCGSAGPDQAYAVATDAGDNILAGGTYGGISNCASGAWPLPNGAAPFVMKLSP